jgi:hypothetical protein
VRSLVSDSRVCLKSRNVLAYLFLACAAVSSPVAFADGAPSGALDVQFRSLVDYYRGHWTCDGHFANGKPISSEETFEPWLDGKWLHELHDDLPPHSYHAHSVWGIDVPSQSLTLTIYDSSGGVRLFVGHDWSGPSIRFEPQPALPHPGRLGRFTFTRKPPEAFSFEYEVSGGDGKWSLGDHVDCRKAPAANEKPTQD